MFENMVVFHVSEKRMMSTANTDRKSRSQV